MTLESYLTENTPYYDPRVVIYERKMFIRLTTGRGQDCSRVRMRDNVARERGGDGRDAQVHLQNG